MALARMSAGRPSSYSEEITDQICDMPTDDQAAKVADLCKDDGGFAEHVLEPIIRVLMSSLINPVDIDRRFEG